MRRREFIFGCGGAAADRHTSDEPLKLLSSASETDKQIVAITRSLVGAGEKSTTPC